MSNSPADDLSQKLRAWKVEPQIPTGFQREVWQRIAAGQAARQDTFWSATAQWLASLLVRPRFAVALVALSLGGSLAFAHLQAQDSNTRDWRALEARYASSVDPLAMTHGAR